MSVPAKKRFAQVYPQGWQTIRSLGENPTALRVYTFIAEHCDHLNALVCPLEVLAEELGVNERTVRRAMHWLEDRRHLVIAKVGTANAYILNPADIWKNYERYKGYCAFHARYSLRGRRVAGSRRLTQGDSARREHASARVCGPALRGGALAAGVPGARFATRRATDRPDDHQPLGERHPGGTALALLGLAARIPPAELARLLTD